MYVILVYDFREKRVGKMLKLCRRYLNWIQNSVFEGEISEARLILELFESIFYINSVFILTEVRKCYSAD